MTTLNMWIAEIRPWFTVDLSRLEPAGRVASAPGKNRQTLLELINVKQKIVDIGACQIIDIDLYCHGEPRTVVSQKVKINGKFVAPPCLWIDRHWSMLQWARNGDTAIVVTRWK